MDSTIHPHQVLADTLQISRFAIERSWSMFQIIEQMDYFSRAEQYQIIVQILAQLNMDAPIQSTVEILFDLRSTQSDWGSIYTQYPEESSKLILGLGSEFVAQWLPVILQNMTGDAPAEPDPQEIAKVHEEMWADYDNTEDIGSNYEDWNQEDWEWEHDESENVEDESLEIPISERFAMLPTQSIPTNWGLILRLPTLDGWQYILLGTMESIQSSTLEEEEKLLQDLCRRNHEFQHIAILVLDAQIPKLNNIYKFYDNEYNISLTQKKWSHLSGLDFHHHLEQDIRWPGGYSIEEDTQNWNQNQNQLKQSCQTLTGWRISQRDILGNTPSFKWHYQAQLSQKMEGSADQEVHLNMQNTIFWQLLADNKWNLGTSPTKNIIELPLDGNRAPSSKHMCILQNDTVIDLLKHSLDYQNQSKPIFRNTAPIHQENTTDFESYGLAKDIQVQICTEQSQQSQQKSSLNHVSHLRNQVSLKGKLELRWGNAENGVIFLFQNPHSLGFVEDTSRQRSQRVLRSSFGEITMLRNGDAQKWKLQQEIQITPQTQQLQSQRTIKREDGWYQHLEQSASKKADFSQKITNEKRLFHWRLEAKKSKN